MEYSLFANSEYVKENCGRAHTDGDLLAFHIRVRAFAIFGDQAVDLRFKTNTQHRQSPKFGVAPTGSGKTYIIYSSDA